MSVEPDGTPCCTKQMSVRDGADPEDLPTLGLMLGNVGNLFGNVPR